MFLGMNYMTHSIFMDSLFQRERKRNQCLKSGNMKMKKMKMCEF